MHGRGGKQQGFRSVVFDSCSLLRIESSRSCQCLDTTINRKGINLTTGEATFCLQIRRSIDFLLFSQSVKKKQPITSLRIGH